MTTHRPSPDPHAEAPATSSPPRPRPRPDLVPDDPQGTRETTSSRGPSPYGRDEVASPSRDDLATSSPTSSQPRRHAAIVTLTLEHLHQALNLPTNVELRGIVGLPLNPTNQVQVLLVHDALPEAAEACWPLQLDLDEVVRLVESP